jgi:asparagine synthase (glutamine-hydrolysing)
VQTFSIGFDDPSYDETPWSRRVAQHLGVEHTAQVLRPQALELCSHLLHFMDDPIADSSIFPTYLVSRLARERVTVALSGDGGDELFGGYESYRAQELARTWQRAPQRLRAAVAAVLGGLPPAAQKKGWLNQAKRFAEGAALDPSWGHARWRVFCDEAQRALLFTPAARAAMPSAVGDHIAQLAAQARVLDPRRRALYVDFRSYLVDNCLAKVDRMSMACSLEVRVPLLERELVELAFQLPPELLYDARGGKRLLKRVAARRVPRACVERRKEGFSIPLKHWLREELRELAEYYLAPQRLREAGLFETRHVRGLWDEHCAGRANHSHLLWALLVFEQWRERWGAAA